MTNEEKILEYTSKLLSILGEGLEQDDQIHSELAEDDGENLTMFIHALGNCVPRIIYNRMTGDDKNWLEFNHLANGLVFQYCKKS